MTPCHSIPKSLEEESTFYILKLVVCQVGYHYINGKRAHRIVIGAIRLLSSTSIIENIRTIGCTGGGAHKYAKEFEDELEITFAKVDELSSLIRGEYLIMLGLL